MDKKLIASILGMTAAVIAVVGIGYNTIMSVKNTEPTTPTEDVTTESTIPLPADNGADMGDWETGADQRKEVEITDDTVIYPTWDDYVKAQEESTEDATTEDTESDEADEASTETTTEDTVEDTSTVSSSGRWVDDKLEAANTETSNKKEEAVEVKEENAEKDEKNEDNAYKYETKYIVDTDIVNVRKSPSTSSEKIGELKRGTKVSAAKASEDWYAVKTDDISGFVHKDYIGSKEKHDPIVAHSEWHGNLNVRTGPGTSYDKITTIQYGETVTCTEKCGEWYKITLTDGSEGYVSGQYLYTGEGWVEHGESASSNNTSSNVSTNATTNTPSAQNENSSSTTELSASTVYSIVEANSRTAESSNRTNIHNWCDTLASGNGIVLYSDVDTNNLQLYYLNCYSMAGQGDNNVAYATYTSDSDAILVSHDAELNRADVMLNIVKSIGLTARGSMNDVQYATAIASKVTNYFNYNLNNTYVDMNTALNSRAGVCYHYARAVYVLLNYQGIPARIVTGTSDGGDHSWVEATINGKIYTIDPTVVGTTTALVYEGRPSNYVLDSYLNSIG